MNTNPFRRGLLVTLASLAVSTPVMAQVDPNFHVYLAFGQSNMEGNAKTFNATDKTALDRFKVLAAVACSNPSRTKDQWAPGIAPLFRCGTGLSPADYFARTLVDSLPSNIRIGIVPVAVAGAKIEGFDPATYQSYYSTQASWMQNIVAEYGGNPYARLVAMAKVAQKTGVIKGIILHQGESNGGDQQWVTKVNTIYKDLLNDLGLKSSDVPLLVGELANNNSMNSVIGKVPQTIPTGYLISASGLTVDNSDGLNVHFDGPSVRTFGKRYAQKMLALLKTSSARGPAMVQATGAPSNFTVHDVRGTLVGSFHDLDEATMEQRWEGLRTTLPEGIYWIRNLATGTASKRLAGR